MPLNERDYMKEPRHIPTRGRSAREQQSINNNALAYWRRKRRHQRLIKLLVPTFFIVALGIIGSVYFMPSDALKGNQGASGLGTKATAFIDQVRIKLTPSCDARLRNAIEADRKAKIRISALEGEEGHIYLRRFIDWSATANELERMQRRVDSINQELDKLKRNRLQYQHTIAAGCIGSD